MIAPRLSHGEFQKLGRSVVDAILLSLEQMPALDRVNDEVIKTKINDSIKKIADRLQQDDKKNLENLLNSELLKFGKIQNLIDDDDVSEIMVNGRDNVYIERKGMLERTTINFISDRTIIFVLEKIIIPMGRYINEDSPTVDARLPDGSRVNGVIPPVALDGPSITIRKFIKDKLSVDQLIAFGSMTKIMGEFLRACVISRLNVVVSGGTGSGKTTLLNVLSGFIPDRERIVTIEDAAELQLQQDHTVRLETKIPSVEGKGHVSTRDLVRNSLRMRPDRIIIGECRGGETLDMLQAMNTGHDGSLTTLHANSPRDALSRLETMVLMAGMELPVKVIRQQVASAVDLIVQQTRLKDGSRKITSITEVAGMEGDTIVLTDIFKFEQVGFSEDGRVLGELKPTGIRPLFTPRLEASGFKLPPEVFGASISDVLRRR
ncbi:MAG TPA: CpaF family protein [Anaerolineales bacterium]|nr:CpaF family protein [Anaerolineales bacterium]